MAAILSGGDKLSPYSAKCSHVPLQRYTIQYDIAHITAVTGRI